MMTREEAIAKLVEQDVARWGEREREASQQSHRFRTLGLALNELANRADLWFGAPDAELRKAAKAALTPDDRYYLRKGG